MSTTLELIWVVFILSVFAYFFGDKIVSSYKQGGIKGVITNGAAMLMGLAAMCLATGLIYGIIRVIFY